MAVARTRPGDVLSHHAALALHGLPVVPVADAVVGAAHESQYVSNDADGFVARVDVLVEGVVLEFDGLVKYQRATDPGDEAALDPGQVVWLEKRREDRVRRLGFPFERVVWDELARPAALTARLRSARALARSA